MNANLSIRSAKGPDEIGVGEQNTIGQANQLIVSKAAKDLRILSDLSVGKSHEFPWGATIGEPGNTSHGSLDQIVSKSKGKQASKQ
jgi:hypothetical protein